MRDPDVGGSQGEEDGVRKRSRLCEKCGNIFDMDKGKLTQNGVHLKEHEYRTVKTFLENGYDIELIPTHEIKGLRMPDIMLLGLPWEMKAPQGEGKNLFKNTVQNASHQAQNIIIDLRRCKANEERALKELRQYFTFSSA